MEISSLLAVSFGMKIIAAIFIICSILLMLVILIQKGKGGGLSTTFGGSGGGGVLGTKTGDFLTWVTIGLVGLWFFLAVIMAKTYRPTVSNFAPEAGQPAPTAAPATTNGSASTTAPAPAATPAPAAATTDVNAK